MANRNETEPNDDDDDDDDYETLQPHDGRYAVDIRVFLAMIALTMAASFVAGVAMWPLPNHDNTTAGAAAASYNNLPKVNSNVMNSSGSSTIPKDIDDLHLPAGQHLLVDIRNVEAAFLNSESRLAEAMVQTVRESELTLLSYHCHALIPEGISCVGVLLESHISFHTWPTEGVITLDLFTCGERPLLPILPLIEKLFGIGDNIKSQWSHELRGFRPAEELKKNYMADSSDLSLWVLSPLEMHSKKQVYSGMTKFQRVDIWDIVEVTDLPSYNDVLKHNMTKDDVRLHDPEYVTPERLLFLDGTLQSMRGAEHIYHEAMVHPAMFAHRQPKRVAILGGGEGATLREVLKHKTVEQAVMIEIDEQLVTIAREFLADFSDCSDLVGRATCCFDDDRVDMQYVDGREYFVDRFGPDEMKKVVAAEKFDVVIVDALDPEDESTKLSELLYSDELFLSSLLDSLTDEGVLVLQVGTAATIDDPRPDFGIYKTRENLFRMLEANPSVAALLVYEEAHCGFLEPHSFLLMCKTVECRSRWYARSDQVDYQIYDRIVVTHSKQRALTFFDGTTQRSYQWPKKGWETVYCRREPTPFECAYRTLNPKAEVHEFVLPENVAKMGESSFRVETIVENDGEKTSRVYAAKNIPKGSYIMPEHLASSLMVTSRNLEGLQRNVEIGGGRVAVIEDLLGFFAKYSHESAARGSKEYYVEVGGTVLVRRVSDATKANVVKWMPNHPSGSRPKYSPVYERNRVTFDVFMVAAKDIAQGEELLIAENAWK